MKNLEEIYPEPDGWFLVHYRQPNGNDLYFGPFLTRQEALDWSAEHLKGGGVMVPLYKTVDWRR